MTSKNLLVIAVIVLNFLFLPFFIEAQDVLGQETVFNIESSYDFSQRNTLTAAIIKISPTAYWYIDSDFWKALSQEEQSEINQSLISLTEEFETNIYPKLTRTFGSEWSPGIDKDIRITILMHQMTKTTGGYGDTADEYPKVQIPESNEREMIYLNTQHINTAYAKSFLAHEFIHLITFNQKNKKYGVYEDIWLNEARAEYAPTFLGYDDNYNGSNLQRRVKDFLDKPSDSLTEWRETPADYGVVNLFTQYLIDHYGIRVLSDSLSIKETGIKSINTVLMQRGFKEDFAQIFTNWTVAVLINNCQVSEKYCYYNKSLKDFRITPLINYLPFVGESTLSVTNTTKDWSGNWHKFIGGKGTLTVDFTGTKGLIFSVPYLIHGSSGEITIGSLSLNTLQKGNVLVTDFGSKNVALTIIPIAENKTTGFSNIELSRTFSWTASTKGETQIIIPSISPLKKPISEMTRAEILARIVEIQQVVAELQAMLLQLGSSLSCQSINQNLYFGIRGGSQVMCLQEFLVSEGVYPEGITNGNFFNLTLQAVIRFQEKYGIPNTGYVGPITRGKINSLLSK
ncbi:MAG: peptidoglycan-binding domain-containing protein [Candidatus Nealsonbacteria bacterium]